jgi:O-antigen ligase
MYWRWKPAQEGPAPFGPFVNRNHFSTWAMMAVPLCIGYLIAHAAAHEDRPSSGTWQGKIIAAIDARVWLLLASATLLIVATAASLSRSGLVGLAAALACGALLSWHRARQHEKGLRPSSSRTAALVITLAALVSVAVFVQVGAGAIAGRFGASGTAMADRLTIWHDTVPIVHDFWLTGTGMGTFLTSMAIYQRSSPGLIFNQAHNHYLQVAAEGGLLVGVPVFLALSAFTIAAWRSLQADRSGMYWIRAGAASGLFGVAIQSLLETGLTVPSNAALAAVLAAIVIHVPLRPAARNA